MVGTPIPKNPKTIRHVMLHPSSKKVQNKVRICVPYIVPNIGELSIFLSDSNQRSAYMPKLFTGTKLGQCRIEKQSKILHQILQHLSEIAEIV